MKEILIDIIWFILKWIIPDIILLSVAFIILKRKAYFTKKGSNNADKEDMHDISYKSKKGSNIADEELSLPISPTMTIEEAEEVVRLINNRKG